MYSEVGLEVKLAVRPNGKPADLQRISPEEIDGLNFHRVKYNGVVLQPFGM